MSRVLRTIALFLLISLVLSACGGVERHSPGDVGFIPTVADPIRVSDVSAKAYFLYDIAAGAFAILKGANERIYPASLTKLLTALYAQTLLSPQEIITPGAELALVPSDSSVAYIKPHHKLTVEMLIQGMMMPSGNDAAYVVAAAAGNRLDGSLQGAEAVARFMEGMNDYARQLGLCDSHFTVPDGLAGEEHYSTLEDLAIIARHAFDNELIRTFGGTQSADVIYESGHSNRWVHTSLLLDPDSAYYDRRVISSKTGSAGGWYNVISLAEIGDARYIVGVLGASGKNTRFADTVKILDAAEAS